MISKFNLLKRIDKYLVLSLLLFSLLIVPFLNSIPYLDGNIDFVQTHDFYQGGFLGYFQNWNSVHPPLKLFLTNFSFSVLGISPFSYNIIGYFLGTIGIISIFLLCTNLFSKSVARISCLFLSTSPMFLATGMFNLRDYILSILILISLLFYARKRYLIYSIFASLSILTKETGILLPISIIIIEIIFSFFKKYIKINHFFYFSIPIFIYYFWMHLLSFYGKSAWQEWIFAETASKGTAYTIANNLITFNFLNTYAYQHWKQLFLLNFIWIFWVTTLIGFLFLVKKSFNFKTILKIKDDIKIKTVFAIILFSTSYFFTVLSLQTYTIPRYGLPILIFLIISTSWSLEQLIIKIPFIKKIILTFFALVVFLSLFYSIDPISIFLWDKTRILGNDIYALNKHMAGNDGITYNMQYLFIAKIRTEKLLSIDAEKIEYDNRNSWMFPDPNNDCRTKKILKLNLTYNCKDK